MDDAKGVLLDLAAGYGVPAGVTVESVDWLRKNHASVHTWQRRRRAGIARNGDEDDFLRPEANGGRGFGAVIQSVGKEGIRIGSVKRDRL